MYSIIQKYLSKETILSGISKTFKEFTNYIQNISDRGDIINSINLIEFFQSENFLVNFASLKQKIIFITPGLKYEHSSIILIEKKVLIAS